MLPVFLSSHPFYLRFSFFPIIIVAYTSSVLLYIKINIFLFCLYYVHILFNTMYLYVSIELSNDLLFCHAIQGEGNEVCQRRLFDLILYVLIYHINTMRY